MKRPQHLVQYGDTPEESTVAYTDYIKLMEYCDWLESENKGLRKQVGQYSRLSMDSVELESNGSKTEVVLLAADKLVDIGGKIRGLFLKKDYSAIDEMFVDYDFMKFTTTQLAMIARTIFPAKDKLNNWNDGLRVISNIIDARGEDSEHILRGLK
jgi:hypothetical protein